MATKYSEEMRIEIAAYITESGESATSVAEELGINTNTVCRWVMDYWRKHNMPSYAEEKGLEAKDPNSENEPKLKIKSL